MDNLEYALREKETELSALIKKVQNLAGKTQPEGKLRIAVRKNDPQFYRVFYDENNMRKEQYIKKENAELIQALAQKEYDSKLLRIAEEQLFQIQRLIEKYDSDEILTLYEKYNDIRKKLVNPRVISDDTYVKSWESETYEQKNIKENTIRYKTEKGDEVRSKSEKIIADYFYHHSIPYKYEKKLTLKNGTVIYPDFTVLSKKTRKEYYYEHFGMMDNEEYANNAIARKNLYCQNGYIQGIHFLCTYETQKHPLDIRSVEAVAKYYLL